MSLLANSIEQILQSFLFGTCDRTTFESLVSLVDFVSILHGCEDFSFREVANFFVVNLSLYVVKRHVLLAL